ncbi:hypothetical protein EGI09_07270 [Bacillus subtilis]|nr:hypothetical protein [Bacillus subtilis]
MWDLRDSLFPVWIQVIFYPINCVFFRLRRREFEKNHLICRIERMIFIEGDTLTIGKNSDNEKTLR